MDRNPTALKHLHFDLINDNILQKLPAKSLVRFTSTCKMWYYLVKSPQFIATHLKVNRSYARGHQMLILGESLYYVLSNQIISQPVNLDFKLSMLMYWHNPMRFCNGLFFINIDLGYNMEYLLWNPSIKKSKKLESKFHSRHYEECINYEIFGLGFHESSSDHRVVRIHYFIDDTFSGIGLVPTIVDVYCLSTDSWHMVDSSPSRLIGCFGSVFINGAIHWLATTRFTMVSFGSTDYDHFESILLFDLGEECFKEIALPSDVQLTTEIVVDFNEFKGSLAVVVYKAIYHIRMICLWVMTDYGTTESWTKKLMITNEDPLVTCWPPIGLLGRGKLVCREIKDGIRIVLLDVDTGQTRHIEGLLECAAVVDFMDSLVLFHG